MTRDDVVPAISAVREHRPATTQRLAQYLRCDEHEVRQALGELELERRVVSLKVSGGRPGDRALTEWRVWDEPPRR